MIKITRFFYINWLVFPLFICAYFTHSLKNLAISYCVVLVHELFHLWASLLLNVRVKSIIMMPFGMTMRLASNVIKSPAKECVIAISGPVSNIIMAFLGFLYMSVAKKTPSALFFTALNVIIGFLNLLPAMPLDGGRILRSVLTQKIGFLGAVSVTKKITRAISIILCVSGTLILLVTKINPSLILVGSFILLSMISDSKNNEYIIMKDILYSKDKIKDNDILRSKLLCVGKGVTLGELIKKFDYSSFHLIGVINEEKKVAKIFSECEIVDAVTKKSTASTLSEI